jgi:excisionase family DNA binding protein
MEKQFLKIENAAKLIDVSPWTIRKWIKERNLRFYRFGGAIRIKESDLLAFATISPDKPEFCQ